MVKRVDEARRSLQALRQHTSPSEEDPETLAEVRRLEQFIAEKQQAGRMGHYRQLPGTGGAVAA